MKVQSSWRPVLALAALGVVLLEVALILGPAALRTLLAINGTAALFAAVMWAIWKVDE